MHSINSKTDILVVGLVFIGFDAEYFTLGEGGGGSEAAGNGWVVYSVS